jgi:hypothetical protein
VEAEHEHLFGASWVTTGQVASIMSATASVFGAAYDFAVEAVSPPTTVGRVVAEDPAQQWSSFSHVILPDLRG